MSMNIFKKLKQRFFQKDKLLEEKTEDKTEQVKVLMEMSYTVFHPADVMESLLMAMVLQTKAPAAASVKDIKLYSLYDCKDGFFVGSFYALKHNGRFFGNIVGNRQIISCSERAFRFERTDELTIPLEYKDKKLWTLAGKYQAQRGQVSINSLRQMDENTQQGIVVHKFAAGTSFSEACRFYENMNKNN